jgi:gamma-glutamylcyclotransferase (GGCT)/AIG2-like uncharacterized protein YtfP
VPPEILFVYGSLLGGEPNANFLAGMKTEEGRAKGILYRLPAGYPALVPDPGGAWVQGELVTISDPVRLRVLDGLEGVGQGFYRRERLAVSTRGRMVEAWAYVMDGASVRQRGGVLLPTGDWRRVSGSRDRG